MKSTTLAIIGAAVVIGGAIIFTSGVKVPPNPADVNKVSIVDGKQIVEVSVKGGYHPQKSTAKAGMPTVLRFNTNGTYDCSSGVRIPSLGLSKTLPPSGSTDIDIGTPQVATLQGVCVMGMYSFQVDFQS